MVGFDAWCVLLVIDGLGFVLLALVACFVDLVCLVGVGFVGVLLVMRCVLFMCLLVAWVLSD